MAEQILYLSNGTKMPIRDHVVRDEMIHVDLGDGASIAFPLSQVEKVVAGGRDITFFREGDPQANRQVGPRPDGPYPVGGRSSKSTMEKWAAATGSGDDEHPKVERDPATGMSVYRPFKDSPSRSRQQLALTGNQAVLSSKRAQALGREEATPQTRGATTKSTSTVVRKTRQPVQKEWGPPPAPPPVDEGEAGEGQQEATGEGGE
jgi:hypothetical protein